MIAKIFLSLQYVFLILLLKKMSLCLYPQKQKQWLKYFILQQLMVFIIWTMKHFMFLIPSAQE